MNEDLISTPSQVGANTADSGTQALLFQDAEYWVIPLNYGDRIVSPGPDLCFTSLYEAAGALHVHKTAKIGRNDTHISFMPSALVYDCGTCEFWTWRELFEGGFMDDFLTAEELALRSDQC